MICARVRKLLLSVYPDGEISAGKRKKIDSHLESCEACRKFADKISEIAIKPFSEAARYYPPETVWEKVKMSVETEIPAGFLEKALERFRDFVFFPRQVFAAATVTALVLAFFTVSVYRDRGEENRKVSSFLSEEMDFLYSLEDSDLADTWDERYAFDDIFPRA
ncbi:MAG TPA: zf-HC2 domain-containing protein [Candidatus Omnitrophota bacterium]|nr:zf-HC2 domain-containing protein [Candidatus Omnitrophota bacterium]